MRRANAEIILAQPDGSIVLQVRDDKPGISNPGMIATFGGHIEDNEEPIDAAHREINEETNLAISKDRLFFFDKYTKTKAEHGEDWEVYYFGVGQVDISGLEVYEGSGYTIIRSIEELEVANTTKMTRQVLTEYFNGHRKYFFLPLPNESAENEIVQSFKSNITKGHKPAKNHPPVVIATAGLVGSGKTSVGAELAGQIDCVRVSSDLLREQYFLAGYSFRHFRDRFYKLVQDLCQKQYNLWLDLDISNNLKYLDYAVENGYRFIIVHVTTSENDIKSRLLRDKNQETLNFIGKQEFRYRLMCMGKNHHYKKLEELKARYKIWREVDTSQSNLDQVMERLKLDFIEALKND